jgi:hypothetical protein
VVVNARKGLLWRYPGSRPKPPGGFYFPGDAFFKSTKAGESSPTRTIVELAYPSGKLVRTFRA